MLDGKGISNQSIFFHYPACSRIQTSWFYHCVCKPQQNHYLHQEKKVIIYLSYNIYFPFLTEEVTIYSQVKNSKVTHFNQFPVFNLVGAHDKEILSWIFIIPLVGGKPSYYQEQLLWRGLNSGQLDCNSSARNTLHAVSPVVHKALLWAVFHLSGSNINR